MFFSWIVVVVASSWPCVVQCFPYKGMHRRYTKAVPCGVIDFSKDAGGRWAAVHVCEEERHLHFGGYHAEALTMPALAALGGARNVLVLGGADGTVVAQLLKCAEVEKIVLASGLPVLTRLVKMYFGAKALNDEKVEMIKLDPSDPSIALDSIKRPIEFDLIILERSWPGEGLMGWDPPYEKLKELMAPRSLLVQYAASLWDLRRVHHVFHGLSQHFERVFTQTYSSIDQIPWHDIAFTVGSVDIVNINWSWWRQANISTNSYREGYHKAMFVPSATTSRALGLQLPPYPNFGLVQNRSVNTEAHVPKSYKFDRFDAFEVTTPGPILKRLPQRGVSIHREISKFQRLEIRQHDGFRTMKLDNELQLTSLFADFYHEAMVHPAMALLGRRAKRVLVIGAGDGGVASVVLQYPVAKVHHVEIDDMVVNASKKYFPDLASGFGDPRHTLYIEDAVEFVQKAMFKNEPDADGKHRKKRFDVCIIDSTDVPVKSLWTGPFFKALKKLMAPHGILVQNLGSIGDVLPPTWRLHRRYFKHVHIMSSQSPEYASPYMLSMAGDRLDDVRSVDWNWWSSLGISTIYYHPTLHNMLFESSKEAKHFYDEELQRAAQNRANRQEL